jgi:hypothetical protein
VSNKKSGMCCMRDATHCIEQGSTGGGGHGERGSQPISRTRRASKQA